jgi:hypothetical protein
VRRRSFSSRVGELRPSALVNTFGVGSVVDLPHLSVIVMGLDEWVTRAEQEIREPRLLAAVRAELGPQVGALYAPPRTDDTGGLVGLRDERLRVGVPVAPFPRWLLCPVCRRLAMIESALFELKQNPFNPERTRYEHRNCPKAGRGSPIALPVRFVAACEHGHLNDFPWVEFVHGGAPQCDPQLRLDEVGPGGEVADVIVRCEACSASRALAVAFGEENRRKNMPPCDGAHPHLRTRDGCSATLPMRAMLLGASNSWFPVRRSALSIPRHANELDEQVDRTWESLLKHVTSAEVLQAFRASGQLEALAAYPDDEVLAAIERRREASSGDTSPPDLKADEWEVLTSGVDRTGAELQTRAEPVPDALRGLVERNRARPPAARGSGARRLHAHRVAV